MVFLEELHRPRRIDSRIADPNSLVYQPRELVKVGVSKPANAYVVNHAPLFDFFYHLGREIGTRCGGFGPLKTLSAFPFKADLNGSSAIGRVVRKGDTGRYSITSVAAEVKSGDGVNPRARAVLRLVTKSNFDDALIGRSPGLVPRIMRST